MEKEVVLLVEDDLDDVFLVRTALAKAGLRFGLEVVSDGLEAVEYLRGAGGYGDRKKFPFPRAILLDLRMPRMDGFGFLQWLRKEKKFGGLPVVVVAAISDVRDVGCHRGTAGRTPRLRFLVSGS